MINSTTSTERTAHADLLPLQGNPVARPTSPRADLLSTNNAAFLRSALARQPEIRPEVLERAKALAADPSYPSRENLKKIAGLLLDSPDLTEDQS
ncbi:MAG: hypothetical protein ABIS43_15890 [Opitutus sp.]